METLKLFAIVFVLGPVLDVVWFSLVASKLYKAELGPILRMKDGAVAANLWVALPVYILIALLVVCFVLPKAGSILSALIWGALAGFILYGVYDFTNMSFLKDWTWTTTVIDILWGTFMVGAVSAIAYWAKGLFA